MESVTRKGATKHCAFGDCKSDSRYSLVKFLGFPKPCLDLRKHFVQEDQNHIKNCSVCEKCHRWQVKCKRSDGKFSSLLQVTKDTYICILHFVDVKGPTEMYPDPLPAASVLKIQNSSRMKRYCHFESNQPLKKYNREVATTTASTTTECQTISTIQENTVLNEANEITNFTYSPYLAKEVQTETPSKINQGTQTTFMYKEYELLKEEFSKLKKEHTALKKTIKPNSRVAQRVVEFEEGLQACDKKSIFYTGLTYAQILILVKFLKIPDTIWYWGENKSRKTNSSKRKFTIIQEIIFTLVRLRMGLLITDMSYRFSVSKGFLSKVVNTWIQCMYTQFNEIRPNMFPSRQKIKQHLPNHFKQFKNIRVIIDCAEFFCQNPTNFEQQGNLYSQYKSHTTFKVLLGCTPNGGVSFVSDLYEGSISDKAIVQKSNFLELLDKDDLILADRGFTIKDLTDAKQVILNIPPFLNGRQTFTPEEEMETRIIAKQRIYIEHVVGRIKNFRLLRKVLPLSMRGIMSQVVFVCACLVNFQEPLVSSSTDL